jgi:hypothetical protein
MSVSQDPRPSQAIPDHTAGDPALREGVGALYTWLLIERDYTQLARESICRHAYREGTLEGAGYLDADDRAEADEVFIAALEPVPYDSPEWGDPDGLDVEAGCKPLPELPDLRDPHDWPDVGYGQAPDEHWRHPHSSDGAGPLPPLSGGAPEPTAEDLEDYGRWSEDLDRRREAEDFYRRHPLAEFNADRED